MGKVTSESWGKKERKRLNTGLAVSQEEKGTTKDEMVWWHHQLNGHKFERTPGDDEGQGSLACCSPWGCTESDPVALTR